MLSETAESKDRLVPFFIIHTLGKFDVIKDDSSVVESSSKAKRIWELYKFMLSHRDKSFTPETLMDQLWVSQEYNNPRNTLRRQMHRLRQVLLEEDNNDCEKTILFSNGYYQWNKNISIQVDTDLFEDYVKQGDALKDESPERALDAYQSAMGLYIGDYLPGCVDQHWVFSVRNHFRRLYLKTVLNTIGLLHDIEAYDEITQVCQKAIHIDIYEETFHLSLMNAYYMRGEQRQALEHYEYITKFYEQEMGVKPTDEMRAIYKKLLKMYPTNQPEMSLYEALESSEPIINAFYCEAEVFRSIYELERRRSERSGVSFSIGVLTATPINGYTRSQKELRMNGLKQHLMEQLRKGDTFTRWSDQQFVVLLPGVDAELTEKVLKRVLSTGADNGSIVISQITHLTAESQHI
ncbi:MAG: BTAD domain-containing putative transcriptional regulator [Vallitaleaceae bacterium]|jgi:DNA-binding SARP family transcriptional activator|nr:BTAD domain-containing putative transcriptional regulator [Vallitaleaceae bacterium]